VLVVQCVFLTRCFGVLGHQRRILKVLDAEDVFHQRVAQYREAGIAYNWFATDAKEETRALRRADVILAIQETELRALRSMAAGRPVILTPHLMHVTPCGEPENGVLLFVGAHNTENVVGLRHFISEALPHIVARHPQARLLVAGRASEALDPHSHVEVCGVVHDLSRLYNRAAIVVNTTKHSRTRGVSGNLCTCTRSRRICQYNSPAAE
jgi:hypothetical protein